LNKIKNELEKVRNSEAEKTELVKSLESQLKEAIINRDQEISKLQEATAEIEVLKKQYEQLKNQISENDDLSLQNNNTDNSSIIENLTKQLKEARNESKMHRERVEELENITKQLESDKSDQMKTNENLLQQVEQLQKELGSLAEEFSDPNTKHEDADVLSNEQKKPENDTNKTKSRRSIIFNRNLSLKKSKNKDDESSNLAFAKLTEVNNSLRKTNENLTSKIIQAQTRMNALSEKIKHLESELMSIKLFENDASNSDGSVKNLKEKIRELEAEKEGLEQANSVSNEERSKLDQKIKSLLEQLESVGKGGNETALQLSALNNKIIELENEVSSLKQQSTTNTTEMEKEISKLLEINDKLGKEVQKNEIKNTVKRNSMPTQESEPTSPTRPRTTSLDGSLQTKLLQQENAIMEQENLIKILREKIFELETRTDDDSSYDASSNSGMLDLDAVGAVGGFRRSASNLSETAKKKNKKSNVASVANYPMTPPPTPPPSHSLSSLLMANSPTSPGSRSPTHGFGALSPPPRNFNSPTPGFDINNAQPAELVQEIQKLHRKIVKIEGDNIENSDHIGNLESSLKENETNLRVAKQQLQILQREKTDLLDQIKKLRSQLDETTALFENAKSSVQEEKKVIENVLEEERRAKENAEKARRQLENQMEELMAKRSKFMCF
jgi:chromosome segregation ATPase